MKAFGERMVTREMRGQGCGTPYETRSPNAGLGRRGFLGALFGGAAAIAVDPERLLWMPGRKLISIPTEAPIPYASVREMMMSFVKVEKTKPYDPQIVQQALTDMNAMINRWNRNPMYEYVRIQSADGTKRGIIRSFV